MKKLLLVLVALLVAGGIFAQNASHRNSLRSDFKLPAKTMRIDNYNTIGQQAPTIVSNKQTLDDPITATGTYDLPTNGADDNHRIYRFDDGKMVAIETFSTDLTGSFGDRGTGYNYFNGTAWGAKPTTRIESVRTGWGSYAPYLNGEIVVAHKSGTANMVLSKRAAVGTGAWTTTDIPSPTGETGMLWPRVVTSGATHNVIHIIALTPPVANSGTIYQGQDGALLYNRSTDGGATWVGWTLVPGIGASDYLALGGDSYCFAEPKGDTLAFVIGDNFNDWAYWKSNDAGQSWTKNIIWPCPYNLYSGADSVALFYCPDGCVTAAFDNQGKLHTAVGLQRASASAGNPPSKYWYPFTDGLLYWNEDMPALDPVLDPDILYNNGNYIGWCPDTMVFYAQTTELAYYYCSMSSMPQIVTDADGQVFVLWSSVTNFRDPSNYMLRHLFGRMAYDNGGTWNENFYDFTDAFVYNFEECVYPSAAASSDSKLYVEFMGDTDAGVYLKGSSGAQGQTAITQNDFIVISPTKAMFGVGVDEKKQKLGYVSQNYPNPVHGTTTININVQKPCMLNLEVYNIMGQKVMSMDKGFVANGAYQFNLDCSQFTSGVYFYTVKLNGESYTNKMIVE
jgi:hypothetical protein